MKSAPLVSIVIPAYNPRFFRAALQSAIEQQYENLEIIVCDDCRTDEIKAVFDELSGSELSGASAHSLRYVANASRLGFQANVVQCLNEAEGEYIKFLCDDDLLAPHCITKQAWVMDEYADVSVVIAKRNLIDPANYILPVRMENVGLAQCNAIYRGVDLLAVIERAPRNILSNFSGALMRRAEVAKYLPALAQEGQGFVALLDFALFVCLLRHGNLAELPTHECSERLHPGRFSKQPGMYAKSIVEWEWLTAMLAERGGEKAPASGWVRYVIFGPDGQAKAEERAWEETNLYVVMADRQAVMVNRVGFESESFNEVYAQWLACRQFSTQQKKLNDRRSSFWSWRPRIVPIVIDDQQDALALEMTLQSIRDQDYAAQTVVLLSNAKGDSEEDLLHFPLQADWSGQLNGVLQRLEEADWFYLLRAGDRLTSAALLIIAERIANTPGLECLYSDEGALDDGESVESVFKPDFNLDLLRGYPYVGRNLLFERGGFLAAGAFDPAYGELAPHDALWRLVENSGTGAVGHIAEVLVESTLSFSGWLSREDVMAQSEAILAAHLQRIGVAHVIHHDHLRVLNRVEYLHAAQPLVSVIIPVKDDLVALERCVDSLLSNTAYANYEVLIVDKGSETAEMREWLAAMAGMNSLKLRVLACESDVSESGVLNLAAAQARGEYLLSMSPGIVIQQSTWLDEMLNHAQRPEVGITGARILSDSGAILHAGMVLGMNGMVGMPFSGEPASNQGYMQRLQLAQNWSAVTGQCLMIRKAVFDDVGGVDEATFSQGLFDVDLCMRVAQHGYLVVWTPAASVQWSGCSTAPVLSESDGAEQAVREQRSFYQRWLPAVARDPAYNQNLQLNTNSSFGLNLGHTSGWAPFCSRTEPSILALAVNSTAVGHYRCTQPFLELEVAGRATGRATYEAPSTIELQRQSPDIVVFQGGYSGARIPEMERIKTYSGAMRIFELDDYVISVPKKNDHTRNMPSNMVENLPRGIALCDRVVVSTQPLADALAGMHSDIRVVPNMLAPHLWSNLRSLRRTSAKPRVGWAGGTSHRGDLELIVDVVRELADEVHWVFFGMCPDLLKPYVHEFYPGMSLSAYPAKLASLNLDLALAPLEFHIFNDCKSNLRLLEYGACGYPVICTDTEAYKGHLPCTKVYTNSTAEWLQAIRMHLSDPEASYRQGDELREAVLRDFMLRDENLQYWVNGWFPD